MRWANFGDSLWYVCSSVPLNKDAGIFSSQQMVLIGVGGRYADAMAVKAAHGYGAFCRQDYIGAGQLCT